LYGSSGLVRFEYHHYAFLGGESVRAAEAAECANEQGMFWPFHDTLFLNQIAENAGFWSERMVVEIAVQLGLDEATFSDCLDSRKYRDVVSASNEEAAERGVNSTPTVFINGEEVKGLASATEYVRIINTILGE
jgi:protein-disulfide isomerase